MCKCQGEPVKGRDGRDLKQACVSGRLSELDQVLQRRSPYKAEVSYDMTQDPPRPIMDRRQPTKPHGWLPGWLAKYWDEPEAQRPAWEAGQGYIRRPDVVIVKDPTKPPTQDNIQQVVEMKFPPQETDRDQKRKDERIAGDPSRALVIGPQDCDCSQPREEGSGLPQGALSSTAALASALMWVMSRGRGPCPSVPAY